MIRTILLLAGCLALTFAQTHAKEPPAPPYPSGNDAAQVGTIQKRHVPGEESPSSIYIGNYGQTIEIHDDWAVEARMVDTTEVVYFHPKFKDGRHKRQPYQPVRSDYTAENFGPMRLMELVVTPKNAPGGFPNLEAIRKAKEKEFNQNHVEFEINNPSNDSTWPRGTLLIQTTRPYRLRQVYAETLREFYILTLGGPLKEGDYGLSKDLVLNYDYAETLLRRSLSNHLLAGRDERPLERVFSPVSPDSRAFLSYLKVIAENTWYWIAWGSIFFVLVISALWPGESLGIIRAHFISRSLIFFSVIIGLLGFLSVYIPVRTFGVMWRHSTAPELIPLILAPIISWMAAKCLGSSRPRSVLYWSTPLAASLGLFSYQANDLDSAGSAAHAAFANAGLFLVLGLVFGVVFILAYRPLAAKEPPR